MQHINGNCKTCSGIKTVTKWVLENYVIFSCNSCKKEIRSPSKNFKKKIIYLDQFLFSVGYKNLSQKNTRKALHIFNRLKNLTAKQLIICPYSRIHDIETHLFRDKADLFKFIIHISRGKSFYHSLSIKQQQLVNAYCAFLKNSKTRCVLNLRDAISVDIHDWDKPLSVNINWSITNLWLPKEINQSKERFSEDVIKALPFWRDSNNSLKDDYTYEIYKYKKILLDSVIKQCTFEESLQNQHISLIATLRSLEIGGSSFEERSINIMKFIGSEYFDNIPYINISAGLWAVIKQKIKKKQLYVKENLKEIQSLIFDIEHLSVFAPYCDAVFFENRMADYFYDWTSHPLGNYSCKVFSTKKSEEFDIYLDEIESDAPPEILEAGQLLRYM